VLFSTASSLDYEAAIVTEAFVHGGWWNVSRAAAASDGMTAYKTNIGQLQLLQENAGQLQRLSNHDCIEAYATSTIESTWRNVLVVSSVEVNDSVLHVFGHQAGEGYGDIFWPCFSSEIEPINGCTVENLLTHAENWTMQGLEQCQACETESPGYYNRCDCRIYSAPISYCLAEPFPPRCTMTINTHILIAVIIANVAKLLIMLLTILSDHTPLATVGDAIASFLEKPDERTRGLGPISAYDVKKHRWQSRLVVEAEPVLFRKKTYRWAQSVSFARWSSCIVTYVPQSLITASMEQN
jgi:hypothetical protein